MKNIRKTILIILSATLFACCSDYEDLEMPNANSCDNIYTRAAQPDSSWTGKDICIINGSKEVKAPWSELSVTLIPYEIRKDVYEEDGWDILFSSVQIKDYERNYNYSSVNEGANYIIFYNRYSGFLKGFCYIDEDVSPNNCGVWHISTNEPTKLFNFVGDFATPYNGTPRNGIYTTNITEESVAGGFTRGWNCFMVELAYDADSDNQHLNISGISLNQATYDFTGNLIFNTTGTYVTTSSTPQNPILTGIASAAGEGVKNVIEKWETDNNVQQSSTRSIVSSLVATGVTTLISNGLNKVFRSITGSSKTTNNDITLSSKGEASVAGTSQVPASGIIVPLSGISLNTLGYDLGVWNVSTAPRIEIERNWGFDGDSYKTLNKTFYYYTVNSRSSYNVIFNPNIQATHTSSSDMLCSSLALSDTENAAFEGGTPYLANTPIVGGSGYNYSSRYRVMLSGIFPNGTDIKNKPCLSWERINLNVIFDGSLSIKHMLTTPLGRRYYSSHTFKVESLSPYSFVHESVRPYSWTYTELKNHGFIK